MVRPSASQSAVRQDRPPGGSRERLKRATTRLPAGSVKKTKKFRDVKGSRVGTQVQEAHARYSWIWMTRY